MGEDSPVSCCGVVGVPIELMCAGCVTKLIELMSAGCMTANGYAQAVSFALHNRGG